MKTLILSGFGTNCERETLHACKSSGAEEVDIHHINTIYGEDGIDLNQYHFLVLIGGFMDGDDLGGARACTNRFRYRKTRAGNTFLEQLQSFTAQGRLALGICNGFQLLVKLGLLPGRPNPDGLSQEITLSRNANSRYENRWVRLRVDPKSPSVFTRGLEAIELPIRHGDGQILAASRERAGELVASGLVPLRYADSSGQPTEQYPDNPNGSINGIASLCNAQGTVMGLMPHPEAFNHFTNHPQWTRFSPKSEEGDGLILFKNAYRYLRES